MPRTIRAKPRRVPVEPLDQDAFAAFGSVVTNPFRGTRRRDPQNVQDPHTPLPTNATLANQGSAVKFSNVTALTNDYDRAPSGVVTQTSVSLFACRPRSLRRLGEAKASVRDSVDYADVLAHAGANRGSGREGVAFDVRILERHPYTSQTFAPMGLSADDVSTCYLVVVAPTLPLPPGTNSASEPAPGWKGDPDLDNMRSFLARGDQAVTYAAGTWHAPVVVLGREEVDFMVFQFANGVADEDCQEVLVEPEVASEGGPAVVLNVPLASRSASGGDANGGSKL